jgi:hypothetical protein
MDITNLINQILEQLGWDQFLDKPETSPSGRAATSLTIRQNSARRPSSRILRNLMRRAPTRAVTPTRASFAR